MTSHPITWGELDPDAAGGRAPDELVRRSGHERPLWTHDHDKARRMIDRMKELSGNVFRVSPDLYDMLIDDCPGAWQLGYSLILDESLPENSVVKAELP